MVVGVSRSRLSSCRRWSRRAPDTVQTAVLTSVAVMRIHLSASIRRLFLPAMVALMLVATPMPAAAGTSGLAMTLDGRWLLESPPGGQRGRLAALRRREGRRHQDHRRWDVPGHVGEGEHHWRTRLAGTGFSDPNYAAMGCSTSMYNRVRRRLMSSPSSGDHRATPDVADPNSERNRAAHRALVGHESQRRDADVQARRRRYLFITTGDGGGRPRTRAQQRDLLVGKILRINPLDPDGSGPLNYSIPAGNPYVGRAGRDEIWAYGLRNPWRCSFDDLTESCGAVTLARKMGRNRPCRDRQGHQLRLAAAWRATTSTTIPARPRATCARVSATTSRSSNTAHFPVAGENNSNVDRRLCVPADRLGALRPVHLCRLRLRPDLVHLGGRCDGSDANRAGQHNDVHQLLRPRLRREDLRGRSLRRRGLAPRRHLSG